jgi:hypothetical protein
LVPLLTKNAEAGSVMENCKHPIRIFLGADGVVPIYVD